MITGTDKEKTKLMTRSLRKFFEKQFGVFLQCEVPVKDCPRKKIDLAGNYYGNEKALDFIAIEVKSSYVDLWSGHGHNFVGTSNYLCVPQELVGSAICFLRERGYDEVGVIQGARYHNQVKIITYPIFKRNNVREFLLTPPHLENYYDYRR